jgi:RNA polymerase sigma factor (sigma-70 family)
MIDNNNLRDLIKRYQEGDDRAFSQIWTMMQPSISRIIKNKNKIKGYDRDDIKQELAIRLISALRSFEHTKNCNCFGYLYMCLKLKFLSIKTSSYAKKMQVYNATINQSDLARYDSDYSEGGTECDILETINYNNIKNEQKKESYDIDSIVHYLQPILVDREIVTLILKEYYCLSYNDISAVLQLKKKDIDNVIYRARIKLKLNHGDKDMKPKNNGSIHLQGKIPLDIVLDNIIEDIDEFMQKYYTQKWDEYKKKGKLKRNNVQYTEANNNLG